MCVKEIIDNWSHMCWVQSAADGLVGAHIDARKGLWAQESWRFVDLNDSLRSVENIVSWPPRADP